MKHGRGRDENEGRRWDCWKTTGQERGIREEEEEELLREAGHIKARGPWGWALRVAWYLWGEWLG